MRTRAVLATLMLLGAGAVAGAVLHFVPGPRDHTAEPAADQRPDAATAGLASETLHFQVARLVASITDAARRKGQRLKDDRLAENYIRAAAAAACEETAGEPARAFVVALGFGLDDTNTLANQPVVTLLLDDVETAEQRALRCKVLGKPSVRGRNDLLLHFAISAALTGLAGAPTAEAFGVQKEIADARGKEQRRGSGFSFVDLAADLMGIELANVLLEDDSHARARLRWIAEEYRSDAFMLDPSDLDEGLLYSDWAEQYGDATDPRFRDALESLRRKVRACPGWVKLRAARTPSRP
jgi:hypothetical protein